jgi:hypothetical protein
VIENEYAKTARMHIMVLFLSACVKRIHKEGITLPDACTDVQHCSFLCRGEK